MERDRTAYEKIWRTVSEVPFGRVASYGQIADLAGFPRQARLVGYALHKTPRDISIPWHRIINARGMISFPRGSGQYRQQQDLLALEGVELINHRIDLEKFRWRPSLDELLWKP